MISGKYTGIGSRETPLEIRDLMTEIAMHFQSHGYTLRTGSVSVADRAFEIGAGENKEIYVPWNGWNDRPGITSVSIASTRLAQSIWEQRRVNGWEPFLSAHVDEKWDDIHPGTKDLLAKSVCMVLGKDLNEPSDALVCWTPQCRVIGISAHVMVLAAINKIPMFNLCDPETLDVIKIMLRENRDPGITIGHRRDRCENNAEISGLK